MTEFSPEKFEDKYEHYFPELQTAYRNAFEAMGERYDSELIHAIDQQILNESEPFYEEGGEGDGSGGEGGESGGGRGEGGGGSGERGFRIELPGDPAERVTGVVVGDEKVEGVLAEYVDTLEAELAAVFGLDEDGPKA